MDLLPLLRVLHNWSIYLCYAGLAVIAGALCVWAWTKTNHRIIHRLIAIIFCGALVSVYGVIVRWVTQIAIVETTLSRH